MASSSARIILTSKMSQLLIGHQGLWWILYLLPGFKTLPRWGHTQTRKTDSVGLTFLDFGEEDAKVIGKKGGEKFGDW